MSINVCGLAAKSRIPEFVELISQYDIIGIQESKTDESDNICFAGYNVTYNNRQNLSIRKSGGIVLLVKNDIKKYIKVDTHQCSKLVQWFTISEEISPTSKPINCGIVYVPPYGSKYSHEDPFQELQREILRFCQTSNNMILLGDFNARTGEKKIFKISMFLLVRMWFRIYT